jgi:hypothetical protein
MCPTQAWISDEESALHTCRDETIDNANSDSVTAFGDTCQTLCALHVLLILTRLNEMVSKPNLILRTTIGGVNIPNNWHGDIPRSKILGNPVSGSNASSMLPNSEP